MGPHKLKIMNKVKKFFKSFLSVITVMLGAYLLGFYINNEISFTSVFVGIIGMMILYPAIKKWNKTYWGSENLD